MSRLHNFSAGPALLPVPVLEEVRDNLLDFDGTGLGAMEYSHRSARFEQVIEQARQRLRRVLSLSDDQEVLFLHGGAKSQFFMVPMNLLRGARATYLDTGTWAHLAAIEAQRFGTVDTPFSSESTGYRAVPLPGTWGPLPENTAYLHYTSNNTVAGTQYHYVPQVDVPLVCDMSSDIASRPIDGSRFDLIYAGAQKNLGPSGLAVVVIRRELLERGDKNLPMMLRYDVHARKGSMYNTPNTWAIYVMERVLAWIEEQGIEAIGQRNQAQAERLYAALDASELFSARPEAHCRSWMNPTFTSGDDAIDTRFWKAAAAEGLVGLKGHRLVGGLRASLYNAQTDEAVDALVDFLRTFERTQG